MLFSESQINIKGLKECLSKGSELELFISLSTIIFMLLIKFIRSQNVSFKSIGTLTSICNY